MDPLICPKCLAESCLKIDIADGDTITCPECEDEYSYTDVRAVVESWGPVVAKWLAAHPNNRPDDDADAPAADAA